MAHDKDSKIAEGPLLIRRQQSVRDRNPFPCERVDIMHPPVVDHDDQTSVIDVCLNHVGGKAGDSEISVSEHEFTIVHQSRTDQSATASDIAKAAITSGGCGSGAS
jgi:hypothetical protein